MEQEIKEPEKLEIKISNVISRFRCDEIKIKEEIDLEDVNCQYKYECKNEITEEFDCSDASNIDEQEYQICDNNPRNSKRRFTNEDLDIAISFLQKEALKEATDTFGSSKNSLQTRVKNSNTKDPKRKHYKYPNDLFLVALEILKSGGSYKEASIISGIPKSSLYDKIKNPKTKGTFGSDPILTYDEEKKLVDWVISCAERGFPRRLEDLKSCVQKILNNYPRKNAFTNNTPGRSWYQSFLRRHPKLIEKSSEKVASSDDIEKTTLSWFQEINTYIKKQGLENVIENPKRIYYGDKSTFHISTEYGKLVKNKTKKISKNITVKFSFSASAKMCDPMIIYARKRISKRIQNQIPSTWGIGVSKNGLMTSEIFYDYISNIFHPHLIRESVEFPVLYFVDGQKTHLSLEVTELCARLQIHLIAIYPLATPTVQLNDNFPLQPIKAGWKNAVREWKTENGDSKIINKFTFPSVLCKCLENTVKKETLIKAFEAAGLFPFHHNNGLVSKSLKRKRLKKIISIRAVNPKPTKLLSYNDFCEIVGKKGCNELNEMTISDDMPEATEALLKIWKYFHNDHDTKTTDKLQ